MKKDTLFVPFSRPALDHEEEEAVLRIMRSGWLTTGNETLLFEKEFAQAVAPLSFYPRTMEGKKELSPEEKAIQEKTRKETISIVKGTVNIRLQILSICWDYIHIGRNWLIQKSIAEMIAIGEIYIMQRA